MLGWAARAPASRTRAQLHAGAPLPPQRPRHPSSIRFPSPLTQGKIVALTWEAYHALWHVGVRESVSGSSCPAVKTWYEKDSPVRWERRKENAHGRTNRSTASRMKVVVWYMDSVIEQHVTAGLARPEAVAEAVIELTAKWKNDKQKAALACAVKYKEAQKAGNAPADGDDDGA